MLTWNHVYKVVLQVITYVNMESCVQGCITSDNMLTWNHVYKAVLQVITYVNIESCVQGCITSDNMC